MKEDDLYSQVLVLTGSIGSGKSTAAQILADLGAAVVSADQLSREVVQPNSEALLEIANTFGNKVLCNDGTLDRRKLAEIVFNSPEDLKRLERITHPRIRKLALEEFERALSNNDNRLLVYDCPLFFEARLDRFPFRAVLLIAADPELCQERVLKRGGISLHDFKKRKAQQIPIVEKRNRSDYVIENSGSLADLKVELKKLWDRLITE